MQGLEQLNGQLRPYQLDCVKRLTDMPGALIADEMGLGKTVEAIALDAIRRQQADNDPGLKTLVVAPLTGVVDSWVRHFNRWRPDLRVRRVDPTNAKTRKAMFTDDDYDVLVLHWEAVRIEVDELAKREWHHIIADEVHKVKNRNTKQTKALKRLRKVGYKTGLTGTPIINQPAEIWSILNWLYLSRKEQEYWLGEDASKLLRSYWRFYEYFVEYIMVPPHNPQYRKIVGPKRPDVLQQLMEPFYIRRSKKVALPDLPDRYYSDYIVDLLPKQQRAYNEMEKDLVAWIGMQEEDAVVAPVVIAQLTRLQQFADAYAEVTEDGGLRLSEPSAKLDTLMEIIEDTDSQIVVFSQFTQMIELAAHRLDSTGIKHSVLTGKTPQNKRTALIDDFQSGKTQVFLANIRAGGVGIELTASDTAVFLDRSWSPADNDQAESRLHRSGQRNAVHIIDIIARDTVDLGRRQKLELKKSWIMQIIKGEGDTE